MAETNGQRPLTYDHLKSKKQATIKKIRMIMDAEVDLELRDAEQEWGLAQLMYNAIELPEDPTEVDKRRHKEADTALKKGEARVKQARKAAEDGSVEFVFQAVGRKRMDELIEANLPTEEEKKEIERQGGKISDLTWSPETFPPALIAASIVSPSITPEQVMEMWDSTEWSFQELNDLYQTALSAQSQRRLLEVGNV